MATETTWELPTRRAAPRRPTVHQVAAGRRSPWRRFGYALVIWVAMWGLVAAYNGDYSLHYFMTGGHALLGGGGGLHVYALHPELQFGPVTMVVSGLIALAPAIVAGALASVLMLALGLGCAVLLADLSRGRGADRLPATGALVYAFLLSPLWLVLAIHYGHLDDALALFLLAAALATIRRGHWIAAAVLLAAATGAKPWILPMALILVAAPRPDRLKSFGVFAAGVAAPWIPFVLADPRTLQLGRFTISVADDSVLHLLGSASQATPVWDRPLQFVAGAALAAWLARRGRWTCVPFAVLSTRLLLDPQTYLYYAAGLVVAAAMADLSRRRRLPILTSVTLLWTALAALLTTLGHPTGSALVRLVFLAMGLVAIVGSNGWSRASRRPPRMSNTHHQFGAISRLPRHQAPTAAAATKQADRTTTPTLGGAPPA